MSKWVEVKFSRQKNVFYLEIIQFSIKIIVFHRKYAILLENKPFLNKKIVRKFGPKNEKPDF